MYDFTTDLPFPEVLDNSMRSAFVACPQKYFLQYLHHLHPAKTNPDLWAGGCFAKGLEVARIAFHDDGCDPETALHRGLVAFTKEWGLEYNPDEDYTIKTFERMAGALVAYFEEYKLDEDVIQPYRGANGKSAVEFTFAIPIPGTKHPTTGNPIIWAGRFDMLGEYMGPLFVVDEKTTKQLGARWLNQWDLRSQFTGYCWAAKHYGHPVVGAVVRGISILKHDYGHAQVITHRPDWMIERWLDDLREDIEHMILCWSRGRYRRDWDAACDNYGGCAYKSLCKVRNPGDWVEGHYHKRVWNPLMSDKSNSAVKDAVEEAGLASQLLR